MINLKLNFDSRKLRKDQTTENHKCLTTRENTVSWLVKNDITPVRIAAGVVVYYIAVFSVVTQRFSPQEESSVTTLSAFIGFGTSRYTTNFLNKKTKK